MVAEVWIVWVRREEGKVGRGWKRDMEGVEKGRGGSRRGIVDWKSRISWLANNLEIGIIWPCDEMIKEPRMVAKVLGMRNSGLESWKIRRV